MSDVILSSSKIKFIKANFNDLYQTLLPFLSGNIVKIPDEQASLKIAGAFGDCVIGEYDESTDDVSDNALKLEDIWSEFP